MKKFAYIKKYHTVGTIDWEKMVCMFSSEQRIDYESFDIDKYEKRLKPVGEYIFSLSGNGYVPQLLINGKWKTLCRKVLYGGRRSKTIYHFLMPENCSYVAKFVDGSTKQDDAHFAEMQFKWYKAHREEYLKRIEENKRLKELPIINLKK